MIALNPFLILLGADILNGAPGWQERTLMACIVFDGEKCVADAVACLINNNGMPDHNVVDRLRAIVTEDQLDNFTKRKLCTACAENIDLSDATNIINNEVRRLNGGPDQQ